MNRRRLLTGFLAFCLIFGSAGIRSLAADGDAANPRTEPYTYTITFYAGNQGAFTGTNEITVLENNSSAGARIEKTMRSDGSAITVKGLKAGDQVNFDNIQSEEEGAPVKLGKDSQYYVRGLRKGGYDNDTVTSPSFTVEQDQDYVVAYGIIGDTVPYVIHYQDTNGNTLAPSRTYYGNVGDRPVVAFLYIEGYEPQAYNLTKELSKNTAENVFTFVYSRASGGGTTTEVIDEGTTTTVVEGPGGGAGAGAGGAGGAPGAGAGAGGAEAGENADLADEEVPLSDGPQDLVDLDDEDTPLGFSLDDLDVATNMLGAVVVGVSGAAALLVLIVIAARRRKKMAVSSIEDRLDEDKS